MLIVEKTVWVYNLPSHMPLIVSTSLLNLLFCCRGRGNVFCPTHISHAYAYHEGKKSGS